MSRLRTAARSAMGPVSWGGAQARSSRSSSSASMVWMRGLPTLGKVTRSKGVTLDGLAAHRTRLNLQAACQLFSTQMRMRLQQFQYGQQARHGVQDGQEGKRWAA